MLAGVCDGFIGNRMYTKYNVATNDLINMEAPQDRSIVDNSVFADRLCESGRC